MVEKITIDGKDVWLVIEPQEGDLKVIPTEYFTVSYTLNEHESGRIFNGEDGEPKKFTSPVEAVEYAVEKLPVILG
ncbi:hypothetical protein [Chitinophaga sp.]|uniref:hypothetical protein n=1 Tax=Chitinophaga sp. TaxID=1869181 RepID=UPI0031CDE37F